MSMKLNLGQWEETALRNASTWAPVNPEPFGNVPHKILPNFEDPRWTSAPRRSYVPYWTSPSWDVRKEEDWQGEEYKERIKPEDRIHYGRPAIARHPIDEWASRSDYAL